jgi:hypothetical protein
MGGNALKHLNPKRMTSNEIMGVYNHISRLLNIYEIDSFIVPWVESKEDHGDLDILTFPKDLNVMPDIILKIFGQKAMDGMIKNDKCYSIPFQINNYEIVQVDIMIHPSSMSRNHVRLYYTGGDFGLYLGRVAACYGLVFAQEGLRYRANPDNPWENDILLETEPLKSLNVLGYGLPPRFKEEEDMWSYVLSSKLAKPWMFLPNSTNAENRSRDKQRKAVQRFQDWIRLFPQEQLIKTKVNFNVSEKYPHIISILHDQKREWEEMKECNKMWGIDAVKFIKPSFSKEQIGEIIKLMQPHLPDKKRRLELFKSNPHDSNDMAIEIANKVIHERYD